MSLFTVDIRVPSAKNGEILRLLEDDTEGDFNILSSNVLYTDLNSSYYRLEVFSPENGRRRLNELLESRGDDITFKIREDLRIYESPMIEVNPRTGLEFKKTFMLTSPSAVETARKELYPEAAKTSINSLRQNRIGLLSDGRAFDVPEQVVLELERDAYLTARYTGLQGFPLFMNTLNEEHLIRGALALSANYCMLRISRLDVVEGIEIFSRIVDNASIPMVHTEYDETAILLAAVVKNAARHHGIELKNKTAGIIGLNPAGHGLAELLFAMGFDKVFGIDWDTRQLTRLERTAAIASSIDHIYQNADIIIVPPDYRTSLNESLLHEGQIVLSFSAGVVDMEKLSPALQKTTHQGPAPHPIYVLPGMASVLRKHPEFSGSSLTPEFKLRFVESLCSKNGSTYFLPQPSTDLIRTQIEAFR